MYRGGPVSGGALAPETITVLRVVGACRQSDTAETKLPVGMSITR